MDIFNTREDAIAILNKHSEEFSFRPYINSRNSSDIVRFSISKNIFRALGLGNHRPSDVYRTWATASFHNLHSQLLNCNSQFEFDSIIRNFTDDFLMHWKMITNTKIVYGPASKIVNLLVKSIQESAEFRIENVVRFQHVPWDSYTLKPLIKIINELSPNSFNIKIPTNASMSFVNTPELYNILQGAISNLYTQLEGAPPTILYDYFAWNDNH